MQRSSKEKEGDHSMTKAVQTAFIYALLGMVGGVFYREMTKLNDFTGQTSLSFVHLHLFALGMLFFLVVTLMEKEFSLTQHKRFDQFFLIYNLGLLITTATFIWRGMNQVLATELSKGLDASISGIAGIGHIILSIGVILFFVILKKQVSLHTNK